jgi:hypothetical protein
MNIQQEDRFEQAIQALRTDVPEPEAVRASAQSVARRLGIGAMEATAPEAIGTCNDIQKLLPARRNGTLLASRASLVDAHLRECGVCLRIFREGAAGARVDWSSPTISTAPAGARAVWPSWRWAAAGAIAALVTVFLIYQAYWAVPPGVRAAVASIDGKAYLVSNSGERSLLPGAQLYEGDRLRTAGDSHVVLRLSDGSAVEVNQRSSLQVAARGRNMTVSLDGGALIVNAAVRKSGHLYVRTPDCRVAVQGTVFAVNSGIKGSRVAVLQGTVHVAHAGINSILKPGEQIATNENLGPSPLVEQISWSPERARYLELLAQLSTLQQRIGQIPFPQPRYASDILPRVPSDTLLYISIPNLGEFLSEANSIFHDQLSQSPELQQWWSRGHDRNTAELDALVDKIHNVSQYLGDEVVIVGSPQANHPDFAVIADVQRGGLADLLRQQFSSSSGGLTVLDEQTLATATDSPGKSSREYALVRTHEVVFSNSVSALKRLNAQLSADASGFAAGDFGKQIAAAYNRGAGIILAADLHQMISTAQAIHKPSDNAVIQQSGMESVQYLIAEHRELNNVPQNHLNVSFAGARQRVASWLAAPAPMPSLDFVGANAAVAIAVLSKDPKEIADDILSMASAGKPEQVADFNKVEQELQISLRDDLAATLGGEFLIALDGPVLPTPSWKAVIEVNDSAHLENTLERLAAASARHSHDDKGHVFSIEPSDVSGQRYYTARDTVSGTAIVQYTFANGYMILASSRAMLIDALHTEASGDSLGRSSSFRALLPRDDNENYSAVAYQNLKPVLIPLLSQLSGESADAVRKLAADARPTAVCAWGKDNRIEVASDSRLFGFDFLTLGALIDSRNKPANQNVLR